MSNAIQNRYEFIALIEVVNGNPNGDPDAGGAPRMDPETGLGEITNVCINRKIRNYVDTTRAGVPGYQIYVKEGVPMDTHRKAAYIETGVAIPEDKKKAPKDKADRDKLYNFLVTNFFDIRAFGGVMTVTYNTGQVRGPVQTTVANSIDPIVSRDMSITCCTEVNEGDTSSKMGRKSIVPYGLYRLEGFISAFEAEKTGFSEEDVELLWEAILNMFEIDRSATRGKMATRKLIIFKHSTKLGDCAAHKLFEAVEVKRKEGVLVPRKYADYEVTINKEDIPQEVEVIVKE